MGGLLRRCCRAFKRKANLEAGPFAYRGLHLNQALMAVNDLFDHGQPEPGAAALCREKWGKDFGQVFLRNSAARVPDYDCRIIALGLCAYDKATSRSHRLTSVFHQIDEYLSQFVFIDGNLERAQLK